GKQILPAAWIENVRKADVDMREAWTKELRYGSQFWVMPGRDAYMAVGYDRQLIVVMPKLDIVAVMTGSARFSTPHGMPSRPRYGFTALVDQLAGAVTADAPVAADPAATAALTQKIKDATIDRPAPASEQPAMAKTVSGKTWRFGTNDLRVRSITLRLDGAEPSYEYEIDGGPSGLQPAGRFGGPIGFDGNRRVGGRMLYGQSAARGTWSADGASLVMEVQTPGNDDVARVTFAFADKTVEVTYDLAIGFKATLKGRTDD
ncbi:MAG TPA: hypothetical protein VFE11_15480, partial [Dongiaceae bacterium]|nr:hypothetical protein [Dongiaceae bacterium]